MNSKTIAVILSLTAAMSCSCVGCEKNQSTEQSDVIAEANVIPNDVKDKLIAAVEAEPVPVPEDGWTDEALLDTIRINGEKINFPFCLNDLGDAFTVEKSDLQRIKDGRG